METLHVKYHIDSEAFCTVIFFTQHIQIHPQQANSFRSKLIIEWIKQHLFKAALKSNILKNDTILAENWFNRN